MTTRKKNPIWTLFTSVKLALFLLFILAATSILGTIVQQNQPAARYVQEYGENMANILQMFDITDMYNSWWFLSLLGIFSLNLIVCSLERIPNVIRIVKKDNLTTKTERLRKMGLRKSLVLSVPLEEGARQVSLFLASKGWKTEQREKDGGVLLFAQKGGWTRFGVYIVHLSILIILLGAVIGSPTFARKILHKPDFAFKGSIMIPESKKTNFIYSFQNGEKIDLGFTVQCNFFTIEYYNNGMPKTYLSKVSVVENGKPVILKNGTTVHDLKVNKPLTYKGITFYQSSYQPYSDFLVLLSNKSTNEKQSLIIPAGKQVRSKMEKVSFGIINQETRGEAVQRIKIWFTDNKATPATFWTNNGQKAIIKRPSGEYEMTVKQLYATGLQVTKDPGVWFVYTGCGMMLFGLFTAFFMSHRKIYAFVHEEDGRHGILFAGSAHKNKVGFEKVFTELIDAFKQHIT
ncbi:MAG TPA: cytochrome c biogenesis protein ResB [Desulfobulbaceae bacterium]|nr:cytochrome c biogenesis protein ResB [Desulfobulbaceae bacterium]